jgi:hypothetical protein
VPPFCFFSVKSNGSRSLHLFFERMVLEASPKRAMDWVGQSVGEFYAAEALGPSPHARQQGQLSQGQGPPIRKNC